MLVGAPRLASLSGKSKYRHGAVFVALLFAWVAVAAFATHANAAPASGEDQYLEQVPLGGGPSADREKAREDFAATVGGKDGVVTEADVRKAAAKNRKNQKNSDEATTATDPPPAAAESVVTAVSYGPLAGGAVLVLVTILTVFGLVAVFVRRRAKTA